MSDNLTAAREGVTVGDARQANQREDRYFRELLETLPQIIFVADGDGAIEYLNPYWYTFTGMTATTDVNTAWLEAIHPDDRASLLARWEQVRLHGGIFEAEYRLRHHEGGYRWHLGRSTPLTDDAGRVVRRLGTVTDITAQKAAAERLRYYELLIERMSDAVITTDLDWLIQGWNPGATRLYGWTADEVIGRSAIGVLGTVLPGDAADQRPWQTALVERREWSGEVVQRRRDNAPIRVAASLTIITDADGTPLGLTAINRDVTDQHHLAENLRFLAETSKVLGSSLDYRTTLTTVAQLGVPEIADWCTVDMLADSGAIERLAVAHIDPDKVAWAEELYQANPPDPDAPTGLPHVLRSGEAVFYPVITDEMLAAGAKSAEELELARRLALASVMIVPLTIQGRTIGALSFVAAESGRHYTASDLAFAEEVASRAALAVENARHYTAARTAIAVRDEFMALASHELKTPVTSLKMYGQVLQRQAARRGEPDLVERLGRMDRQIDKLTGLINDLLDVARIRGGQLEYVDVAVDLNAVVREVVGDLQPATTKHQIAVEGQIDGTVWGDRERLGQVVTNLLTNAIKYSPQADRVLVHLGQDERGATIEVQDFGIGIDEEHWPHIFAQFYRVSDPSEKTFPGLGIGLYISSEIVRRHRGTIQIASEIGVGTTFIVALPLSEDATVAE